MKLSQVADQGDESEFTVMSEASKAAFYSRYVSKVQGAPGGRRGPDGGADQCSGEEGQDSCRASCCASGAKGGSSEEACFAWNGNGFCGGLRPGEKC